MKILVTGATGFIGSHLCDWLCQSGHDVIALHRSPAKLADFQVPGTPLQGELSTDVDTPNRWVDELPADLDAVVHVAGLTHAFREEDFFRVNRDATLRLAEDLRRGHGRLRFVHVSSLAAAGPSDVELTEDVEPRPVSQYGRSKLQAEQGLRSLRPESWELAIVRPPMVIGPRDRAVADLFNLMKWRLAILPGLTGASKRFSFVGVRDVVRLLELCLTCELGEKEQVYYAAYPQAVRFIDITRAIRRTLSMSYSLPVPLPIPLMSLIARGAQGLAWLGVNPPHLTPDKVREARRSHWICSSRRSQEELSMQYEWDLDRTLAEARQDYVQRKWI